MAATGFSRASFGILRHVIVVGASPQPEQRQACAVRALRIAAERRTHRAALRAQGLSAAGAEALCNGAMRQAIRLSLERSQAGRNVAQRPLLRRRWTS